MEIGTNWKWRVAWCVLVLGLAFGAARADQRSFVWTYEYLTLPPGEAELEYYFTISAPDSSSLETNVTSEHKFEYEVGMTKHFDFAIYQVFKQAPEQALEYKGFQLRARYRFGEKDQYPVDSLLYLEYKGVPDFAEHGIEAKVVLAKTIGRLTIAVNPVLEVEIGEDETEVEAEYAAGVSFAFNELLKVGLEAKGSEYGHYIGPVLAHGKGRFWSTLGSAILLGDGDEGQPELQVRLLLGIGL